MKNGLGIKSSDLPVGNSILFSYFYDLLEEDFLRKSFTRLLTIEMKLWHSWKQFWFILIENDESGLRLKKLSVSLDNVEIILVPLRR